MDHVDPRDLPAIKAGRVSPHYRKVQKHHAKKAQRRRDIARRQDGDW